MNELTIHLMDYCKTCNQRFIGVKDRTYCSIHCRDVGEARYGTTRLYCLQCGNEYTVKDKHNRFCKNACTEKHRKGMPQSYKRCKRCKRPYRPHNYRQRFCTKKCANAFYKPPKTPKIRYCLICAKSFRPYRPNHMCCSKQCSIQQKRIVEQIRYNRLKHSELVSEHPPPE